MILFEAEDVGRIRLWHGVQDRADNTVDVISCRWASTGRDGQ